MLHSLAGLTPLLTAGVAHTHTHTHTSSIHTHLPIPPFGHVFFAYVLLATSAVRVAHTYTALPRRCLGSPNQPLCATCLASRLCLFLGLQQPSPHCCTSRPSRVRGYEDERALFLTRSASVCDHKRPACVRVCVSSTRRAGVSVCGWVVCEIPFDSVLSTLCAQITTLHDTTRGLARVILTASLAPTTEHPRVTHSQTRDALSTILCCADIYHINTVVVHALARAVSLHSSNAVHFRLRTHLQTPPCIAPLANRPLSVFLRCVPPPPCRQCPRTPIAERVLLSWSPSRVLVLGHQA
jgi:hypothetical protein